MLSFTLNILPPGRYSDLVSLVNTLSGYLIRVAIPIAVILIVYAGIKLLVARGDTKQVDEAKKILWWTVVGIAVILIGSGFIELIKSILQIP